MEWDNIFGIGVAGNFTGHLEQAGEAKDFLHVRVSDEQAPKEHVWVFQVQAWITALCWIFLIVPLALFVWFIYEPEFSMRWRRQLWQRWRDRKSKQEQV